MAHMEGEKSEELGWFNLLQVGDWGGVRWGYAPVSREKAHVCAYIHMISWFIFESNSSLWDIQRYFQCAILGTWSR